MDLYFSDQIQIDMGNDDHRALTAFLKIHVRISNKLFTLNSCFGFRTKVISFYIQGPT